MYYLILIVSFVANGASLQVESIPFDSKSSCQEALIEILHDANRNPVTGQRVGPTDDLHIDGWCVAK